MSRKYITPIILVLFVLVVSVAAVSAQALSTSAFTYLGQLSYQGALANGSFDFQFRLFSAQTDGSQIAVPIPILVFRLVMASSPRNWILVPTPSRAVHAF